MIIVKKKNEKMYVYDNIKKKGRYYNIVDGALDEYYKGLFLENNDKIRKKSNKYINELINNSDKGKQKKKQREIDFNNIKGRNINRFNYARNLIDEEKHGIIEFQYKDDYIDDIGWNKRLYEQVVKDKRKVMKLMKHRNYIKDLMGIEVIMKGYNETNKVQNATLVTARLVNCDLEYLKGVLADHKFIGFKLKYAEKAKNEAIFQSIFGTDNIDMTNSNGEIQYIRIRATIGRR